MRKNFAADVSFCILMILMLLLTTAVAIDSEHLTLNLVRLCAMLAILIITYFTSLITGLVINMAVIFAYATYLIMSVLLSDATVDTMAYVIMIASPISSVTVALAFRHTRKLEEENASLTQRLAQTEAFDAQSGLRVRRSYEGDLAVYRALAQRYNYNTTLLIWQFRFPNELSSILGKRAFEKTALQISNEALGAFRQTDMVYLFSREPHTWGALLATSKQDETNAVMERARSVLDRPDITKIVGAKAPRVELRFSVTVDDAKLTADELLQRTLNALPYDV